ncbi:hypothetical protein ABH931_006121 [Streptacidiphilus sp. MAP12-33]|uniref:hypothetical protein n=1 Tax=Streptacidiphilus sp. MAP12-33 TaxID=3156266 RepID=UPI00351324AF
MTAREFGFAVEHYESMCEGDAPTGWKVSLPHQCDRWRIDKEFSTSDPSPQADALAELDRFIAEAQAARAALAAGQPFGDPDSF